LNTYILTNQTYIQTDMVLSFDEIGGVVLLLDVTKLLYVDQHDTMQTICV